MEILQSILKIAAVFFIFVTPIPVMLGEAKPYQFCISVAFATFIAGTTLEFGIIRVALAVLSTLAVLILAILLYNAFIFLARNNEIQPTDYITRERLFCGLRSVWNLDV